MARCVTAIQNSDLSLFMGSTSDVTVTPTVARSALPQRHHLTLPIECNLRTEWEK